MERSVRLWFGVMILKVLSVEMRGHASCLFSLQDVDLVHCRIGKIEGLEVLQKAKVSTAGCNAVSEPCNGSSMY